MKIGIGCDHAGFLLKEKVIGYLRVFFGEPHDYGVLNEDAADYPDVAHPLSRDVHEGKLSFGILICGTGNGMAMTANKYAGVRAALCWNEEIASLARKHNNANVLVLPGRFISRETGINTVKAFLQTDFEGGRHERRVSKIRIT
ncbi:MAG: ribose 5-phosphate isomerase B [Bacteroidetes bacterium]|nr:ribose 5-phosphate isomerase B [Bacteroidota bacterium]